MAFYFAKIWFADSAVKLVRIAAVLVAKISAANTEPRLSVPATHYMFDEY